MSFAENIAEDNKCVQFLFLMTEVTENQRMLILSNTRFNIMHILSNSNFFL